MKQLIQCDLDKFKKKLRYKDNGGGQRRGRLWEMDYEEIEGGGDKEERKPFFIVFVKGIWDIRINLL